MAFPEEPESGVEGWKKAAALKALLEQPSASEDRHEGKAFETASQYLALEAVRPGCPLEEANKTVSFVAVRQRWRQCFIAKVGGLLMAETSTFANTTLHHLY